MEGRGAGISVGLKTCDSFVSTSHTWCEQGFSWRRLQCLPPVLPPTLEAPFLPPRSTALLLLAALPYASSWAVGLNSPTDALDLDSLLLRWSSGVNTSYSSGLKGGIAWAFDPALCDRLLPLFPEEERARSGFFTASGST